MRKFIKTGLATAGGWIPHAGLIRLTGQDFIVPMYHTVSNHPLPHVDQLYPVRSLARFKRDLDFLTRHYRPVGLETLLERRKGQVKSSRPCMFLTFDDGLSGIYDTVAPELLKRRIPAAFFISTDFIDNQDLFFRYKASLLLDRLENMRYPPAIREIFQRRFHLERAGRKDIRRLILGVDYQRRAELDEMARLVDLDFQAYLKIRKPYLTTMQIQELAGSGFYIGAHGCDHPLFAGLGQAERLTQYRKSLTRVREAFRLSYGLFSFPFTDDGVPCSFFAAISSEGMPPVDATFGTAGLKREPIELHYQRIPMEVGRLPASRLLKGEYAYYLLKALLDRNKITRE
jgi:peptidoglycan/xylan/chitin deacetylase (PgdA/CDA1 family)